MNAYAAFILFFLLAGWLAGLVADILNLASAKTGLPKQFEDVWDRDDYARSQQYLVANTRFSVIADSLGLACLLVFWFLGGFGALDEIVRSAGMGEIANGLLFIGILAILNAIVSLPANIYKTFVIEEKFGFNKTSPKTFVLDRIKSAALGIIIGAPLLAGVIWFFLYAGQNAWLYCWGFAALLIVLLQWLSPALILPLFFKFKPLEDSALKEKILQYARAAEYPLQDIFVVDGSRRSTKANAFFTGFGKKRRIALFDTLLERHTPDELVAVLAHEIGHWKKRHVQKGMLFAVAHMGLLFYLLSLFLSSQGLFDAFFVEQKSVYAGLVFFG
ncbi:MAG: M48 family metallopeptidase, partial [Desulfatibacillaceae bacterium]|nr:M48 family metallopeptidase [Desulfatibacillaceae bacterium]